MRPIQRNDAISAARFDQNRGFVHGHLLSRDGSVNALESRAPVAVIPDAAQRRSGIQIRKRGVMDSGLGHPDGAKRRSGRPAPE